jgi:hypothetical protein
MTDKSVLIHAGAAVVYDLVADPMRMAEWSPECVACHWIDGATESAVGARFRGTSRNGRRRWTTTSRITEMRPAALFAWEVTYFGQPVAHWEYHIEPQAEGVELVESVEDRRGPVLRAVSPYITGSPDRARRNADTMESTLQAVKATAEGSA